MPLSSAKHTLFPVAALLLLAHFSPVIAGEGLGCPVPSTTRQKLVTELEKAALADAEVLRVSADRIESLDDETVILTGNVVILKGEHRIQTERAVYKKTENTVEATGDVKFDSLEAGSYSSTHSLLNLNDYTGYAEIGGFSLSGSRGRGNAERIVFVSKSRLKLKVVRYTTCRPDNEDWYLKAKEIEIDQDSATGTARHASINLLGVPIFYSPYLSFPLGDNRRSGFLLPDFGSTDKMGTYFTVPYYWNIAPNYDATFKPRFMSSRGTQLQTQFRYLGSSYHGIAEVEALPNDSVTGTSRTGVAYKHQQQLSQHLSGSANLNWVSDQDYFDDFATQLSTSSQTHLPQSVRLNYQRSDWQLGAEVSNFQTLDKSIAPADYPYARLPQLTLNWRPAERNSALSYQLFGSATAFQHDTEESARRVHLQPTISYPMRGQSGFIRPKVAAYYSSYLDRTVGSDDAFATAIGSIDSGLVFERPVTVKQQAMKQTLEPRLFYVYSPYVDQSTLPVFDTSIPTFSFNSLFQDNRFIGADRVGDTHQLTMAVTTRLIDDSTGSERLTASLGQTYYFSDRKVSAEIPPLPAQTAGSSDIAGEVTAWLGSHWYLRSSLLFDTENNNTRKNSQFLQYRPARDRIFNIGYRFEDGIQELVDISGQWPVTSKWAVLARSQYSIQDKKNQDSFAGLQYETCCWSFRALAGQRVDQDGLQVSSFSFQLIFKGLAGFETGITSDMPLEQSVFD